MGKNKWRSKRSPFSGPNARAPDTAKKQAGHDVLQVFWTPVFTRGETTLYVCDPEADGVDAPPKLNKSGPLACFVRSVLPGILSDMRAEHGWPNLPRVVAHDEASYMVNSTTQQLNPVLGGGLAEAGLRSWTGLKVRAPSGWPLGLATCTARDSYIARAALAC